MGKRPTKETYKRDLQKRPTKETYKRDLHKRRTQRAKRCVFTTIDLPYTHGKRPTKETKETYTRDLQKRPTKETYKRDVHNVQKDVYSRQLTCHIHMERDLQKRQKRPTK